MSAAHDNRERRRLRASLVLLLAMTVLASAADAAQWTIVGWNNLGMHCMDGDYSVLSLLPPYSTIHAQVVDAQGRRVTDPAAAGISVTYEAIADPDGSINTTSAGKTNFWDHVQALFGVSLPVDVGLIGPAMPGAANLPQPMTYDTASGWFIAEGIPLTPYDDSGRKNTYPMMRLSVRDSRGAVMATTDIVLPVSDEMDCSGCHSSSSGPAARPYEGWVNDPDPQRDMRLNILRLHDEREQSNPAFQAALDPAKYNPAGLFATVMQDKRSILCADCHLSEALPGSGRPGVSPLTQAIHRRMAFTIDPLTNLPLDATENRSACYRCHPGSETRCLRGAMGAAVAADGTLAMQCQSCHGSMMQVASPSRTGWLDEPSCENCHTGTATRNNGEIRYLSAFDTGGVRRVAADRTFATNADTPGPGFSLFRFSAGHGGLKCEACHGSTHAIFPSIHANDNVQSQEIQGHVGVLAECTSCHASVPSTVNGGPHGLHPLGQAWVQRHGDAAEGSRTQCQSCHGADYRGTVLSRSQADRTLSTAFGTKSFWRGFQVGCYACHNGPNSEQRNPNRPAVVSDASVGTTVDVAVTVSLMASDADGNSLTLRVVNQPQHGAVGLVGAQATYYPEKGFSGSDSFRFAAWDGSIDSNLGTVFVTVGGVAASPTATRTSLPATGAPTSTRTRTPTPTRAATSVRTPTRTPTRTATPVRTPTRTLTPARTRTPTIARMPTRSMTATRTRTPAATRTPTRRPRPTRIRTSTPTPRRGEAEGEDRAAAPADNPQSWRWRIWSRLRR